MSTTEKVVVKRPANAEEAQALIKGLTLDQNDDSNIIATYNIGEFLDLGVRIPLVDGKAKVRANSNGTLFLGFILNGQWHNAYLSSTLKEGKKGREKMEAGSIISKSKHAVQLRFDEETGTAYYLLVAAGAGSGVATLDSFAD